ncbi:MAG: hypothetical protein U5K31_12770 [Balneolaceae bacterium]|nr:hypothetical protein [Balneolaceae bacterium]
MTLREADYIGGDGREASLAVEPPTNYFVGRVKQDFNGGNTIAGGYLSAVNRFTGADYLDNFLHQNAYVGGVDFEHSWQNRKWSVSGVLSGTLVDGSPGPCSAPSAAAPATTTAWTPITCRWIPTVPNWADLPPRSPSAFSGDPTGGRRSTTPW